MRPQLRATGFDGQMLQPGDDDYDARRAVWNAMVDRRPAVIARCRSTADVAAAVRFGRESGLEIGVRCGGHSVLGISVPDDGLMIDLTGLRSARVDPDARRAWVQGGALLGGLDRAAQQYGLATTAGNVSHTGVGGLTLGGGMGWLAREFGLTCDNVEAFEVVTADGATVRASETENGDLFWGLRGGGGNFGVVTEFEFRLHRIGTAALVANYFYSLAEAPAALRRWRDLIETAPTQATLTAWVGTSGEWPFLPPELHNRPLASAGFVWVGEPSEGRGLLPSFSALGSHVAERVDGMTYLELQSMDDDAHLPGLRRRYWKGHYLPQLPDAAIDAFLTQGATNSDDDRSLLPAASFQSYGGAIASISDDQSAFSNRNALVEFVAASAWTDPAEDDERMAAARRFGAELEPFASGVYVNVLSDEGEAGVRRAYRSDKLARLAELKHRYDPENVFHLNHNIRPMPG
ncbi:MAG: FAD-binding oxidoreductase, partial [Jiangellaceae bacterium]